MSVCFHLMKPIINVEMLCSPYEKMKLKEYKELEKEHPDMNDNIYNDLFDRDWRDGYKYDYIDISYYNSICKNNKKSRLKKQIEKLNKFCPKLLETRHGYTYKYIPVNHVLYYQGWNLKNRFFKKAVTIYICTTKEEMIGFLKKYLDFKNQKSKQLMKDFIDNWEDGMIFECSW